MPVEGKLIVGNDIYITNVTELPYSTGTPEIKWQNKEDFTGWVDLVGWRNATKRNDTFYIYGDPVNLAIVAGDAIGTVPSGRGNGAKISELHSLAVSEVNGMLVIRLIAQMEWYLTCSDKYGTFNCGKRSETQMFEDIEPIPPQADTNESYIEIIKTKYNFSELNRTYLEVEINKNVYDRYNYSTKYGYLEHIYRSWHVEKTGKGVYYANETIIDITNSINVSRARDTMEISESTLPYIVSASGFYTSTNKSRESYVVRELDSSNQFSPYIIGVFLIFYVMYRFCKTIITRRF